MTPECNHLDEHSSGCQCAVWAEPLCLAVDQAMHGVSFQTVDGQRIDPAKVHSAAPGWRGRWVGQEDAEGCSIAVLAMLTGETYADVKAEVGGWSEEPHDWSKRGTSHHTLDRYLTGRGFWMRRHYATWNLPMVPFAPLHYVMVKQPSGRTHFVAMLSNGDVLDPLREGVYSLADWATINQIVGVRGA